MLPVSVDAEQGCLASLLLSPLEVGCLFADIGLNSSYFHIPAHATIFDAISDMQAKPLPVDMITLTEWLRSRNGLDQVGGPALISQLYMLLPTAANAAYYAETVKEKRTLREVIRVCTKYAGLAYEHQADAVAPLIDEIVSAIGTAMGGSESKLQTPKELAMETLREIEQAFHNKHAPIGVVSTGFDAVDNALGGGLRPDDTVLLTGPTKGGKSILAKNIGEHVGITLGKPVCLFSLEMNKKSQMQRVFASQGRVSAHKMRSGFLDDSDMPGLTRACTRVSASKLYIRDDCFGLLQIVAACRQFKLKFPDTALFIFDYVQLIEAQKDRGENRENVVARISTTLRRLTLELGVASLMLAQENKEGDARESSRLEQDCTCRIKIEKEEKGSVERTITVPLARNGPRCQFKLAFLGDVMRFEKSTSKEPPKDYHGD